MQQFGSENRHEIDTSGFAVIREPALSFPVKMREIIHSQQ